MKSDSKRQTVSIIHYEKPIDSVRKVVDLSHGLNHLPANAKVFIKPNIVFWSRFGTFPAFGVITTSRILEDMVILLKERGVEKILIGEGITLSDRKDRETPAHAFETLGYNRMKQKYGVEAFDLFERPYEKVTFGDGTTLNFATDFLKADFLINLPVLKTHAQTMVSLGIKNVKGTLDINSRKKCHSADPEKDLHYMVSKLQEAAPPGFTLIDGIYSNERGPAFDGKIRRENLLIGSRDMLSADKVGARVLGYDPSEVPHLVHAARDMARPIDLSDTEVLGEKIETVASKHRHDFPYTPDESRALPVAMKRMGVQGLSYRKYDLSMCTYCSSLNGILLTAISQAWEGKPWDDVEVLTGKMMKPTPGKKKTILVGKCMYQANKNNPHINELFAVKGCPPTTTQVVKAFNDAGIAIRPDIFEAKDQFPALFMKKYEGKPEFDINLFRVK
ncbi:MAG: DUF362 domain-containing protein [Deltaproteobacteria bacterium]|nr:DUF362 domain-containing protein [Deltaproteobacteria bacterium]